MPLDLETERIATIIVDCAYKVHKKLGQKFMSSVWYMISEKQA